MIYLDNAATSFPKPREVSAAVTRALSLPLGNPGRSSHPPGRESARLVYDAREKVARLLGMAEAEQVAFFGGATQALNSAIYGSVAALAGKGAPVRVFTTVLEHNSVLRPLYALERSRRIILEILTPETLADALKRRPPDLLVMTLCSNVCGMTLPLERIASLCRRGGTHIILDAAQAAGWADLPGAFALADLICAPGHKGLLGIMGAGFLAVNPASPLLPEAVFAGGSGSDSRNHAMPDLLPERLEAGTLPVPALAALGAGVNYVLARGPEEIRERERAVKRILVEGLSVIPGIRVYLPEAPDGPLVYNRVGTDPNEEAYGLEQAGVYVRPGFHCAPLAHAYLGTGPRGAVRLSPGAFNTPSQARSVLRLIAKRT